MIWEKRGEVKKLDEFLILSETILHEFESIYNRDSSRNTDSMEWNDNNERELHRLISDFSSLISSFINNYRVYDYGIDPDDIAQEVRIRLWRTLRNNNTIRKPVSYIKKVVSTVVLDQLKKTKRDDIIYRFEKTRHISEVSLFYPTSAAECERVPQTILDTALENIITSRKTVVKLYLMNMKVDEIAAMFAWSNNKTRNLLYRGLSDLKRNIKLFQVNHDNKKG